MTLPIRKLSLWLLFFKKAFHAAAENSGNAIESIGARLVDVFVPLLVHLDGAERNTGAFCKLSLCAAIRTADAFQIGAFEMLPHLFISDIHKFRDVCFVKHIVHVRQIIEGEDLKDSADLHLL